MFHKVIVITDRVVLDRQLQRTIFQFDHTPGVVKKIDEDSAQLAEALEDATSKIIISTLQMYPYVLDKIAGCGARRPAVRGDHRRGALLAGRGRGGAAQAGARRRTRHRCEEDEDPATYLTRVRGPAAEPVVLRVHRDAEVLDAEAVRHLGPGQGEPARPGERGMYVPFHVYSMRQAIEEGYILDVLANYLTYDTKWRLRNAGRRAGRVRAGEPRGGRAEGQGEAGRASPSCTRRRWSRRPS